jgi:hypothetical protein
MGCILDKNGNYGINNTGHYGAIINCVVNGNIAGGILLSSYTVTLLGNRITNHSAVGAIGLSTGTYVQHQGWNYFQDNDGDNIQGSVSTIEITDSGSSTTLEDQGDTESGYIDENDPEDYTLSDTATLRRTAIIIPES